jgi:NADH:ubiquinone oxidoreductase subunit 3 (subunit A)
MDDLNETTTEESTNLMGKFSQLPGGVQRIIIAVLLLILLVAAFFIQRLIGAEEEPEPEVIPFESAEAFAAEVQGE